MTRLFVLKLPGDADQRASEYPANPRAGVALCLDLVYKLLNGRARPRGGDYAVLKSLGNVRQKSKLFRGHIPEPVKQSCVELLGICNIKWYFGQELPRVFSAPEQLSYI